MIGIAVNMFCAVFVRFGEPYAARIDKDVAQTLLEILNYPHLCHIQSFRHLSQFHLKKHCQNYRYVLIKRAAIPTLLLCRISVAQYIF